MKGVDLKPYATFTRETAPCMEDDAARLAFLLANLGVLVPLFAALGGAPWLRLVSRAWLRAYEVAAKGSPPCVSRCIVGEEELARARAEGAHNVALLRVCNTTENDMFSSLSHYNQNDAEFAHARNFMPRNLANVHELHVVNYRDLVDVSVLSTLHTLTLDGCWRVADVSALRSVHTLTLIDCRNVTDVSALGSVHTLPLPYCRGITHVSALGSAHTLKLSQCRGVTDVSAPGSVHTLE